MHEDARIVDLFRYPSVRAYAAHVSGASPAEDPRRGRAPAADARRAARQRRGQQVSRKKQLRADAFRPVND
ncbi:hypothetical protein SAZ11_01895 [Streptomyces sp. FXJ1.4098]|nr:hypothetical protein [Streptomyces sp. FXJ1.4098]